MKASTKNELEKTIATAVKQLKQAVKNIDKAEEIAFRAHADKISDGLEKDAIEVCKITDSLYILDCMVKHRMTTEEDQ